jgi:hypothetical protein
MLDRNEGKIPWNRVLEQKIGPRRGTQNQVCKDLCGIEASLENRQNRKEVVKEEAKR